MPQWNGLNIAGNTWQLHCGDAHDCLTQIPSESVDCIITSPPYFWLRDYGVDGQIGLENSIADYVESLFLVGEQLKRILKPEGTFFLNIGDTYYSGKGQSQGKDAKSKKRRFGLRAVDRSGGLGVGLQRKSLIGIPWRIAMRLCESEWVLRSSIIWHREKCLPESVRDRPRRSYEFVFMFAKSRRYYFNREHLKNNRIDEDVWTISPRPKVRGEIDTAAFPDELVHRCIQIGCPVGGSVLDPFAGSGTTLRVSLSEGRNAIGIELNEDYCRYILNEAVQ